MKSVQLIKQVNNTELGKGGTHETYILIPQDLDISDLFEEINKEYTFKDKVTGTQYTLRLTSAREKRIVGLGPYYRDNNVMAGDQVLLERQKTDNDECKYFVSFKRAENTVYFQKVRSFFEVLTSESIADILDKPLVTTDGKIIKIEYHGEVQKRRDSPTMTKVYTITINDVAIQGNYQDRDMIGIRIVGDVTKIIGAQPWKKYIVEVEE